MSLSENRVTNNAAVNHHHIPYQHAICGFRHTHMQDYLVAPQVFSSFCRNDAQGASEFEKQTPALATCGHGDPLSKPYLIIYIYTRIYRGQNHGAFGYHTKIACSYRTFFLHHSCGH